MEYVIIIWITIKDERAYMEYVYQHASDGLKCKYMSFLMQNKWHIFVNKA